MNGASVGGYIGGNYRFNNNPVIGVEGDYNAAFGSGWDGGELDSFGTIRARVGYAMDRWLIYAAGGVAFAQFGPASGFTGPDSSETGWTLGGGAEYVITDHVSLRGECTSTTHSRTSERLPA
jgi:outer membrane immunogenic protein